MSALTLWVGVGEWMVRGEPELSCLLNQKKGTATILCILWWRAFRTSRRPVTPGGLHQRRAFGRCPDMELQIVLERRESYTITQQRNACMAQ